MSELKYFFSTREDGNMNTNRCFYKKDMTNQEIRKDFDNRRLDLGIREGFNGYKVITPIQKTSNNSDLYEDGKSVRITRELIEDYRDLYDLDIYADILTMDGSICNIALAYPVADCPVVFAHDTYKNTVGMAHCSGDAINRGLPGQLVDAMRETFDSKIRDLSIYIAPFIHAQNYVYDRYPKWATNEYNWHDCIWISKNLYYVDLEEAITKQLMVKKIDEYSIYASAFDTVTNDKFYSNSVSRKDPSKAGRFYEGCFFTSDIKEKVKVR